MSRVPAIPYAAALSASLLLAACAGAPPPSPRVTDLQARVDQARGDPTIARYAGDELRKAEDSLAQAKKANEDGDQAALDHDVYMAQRQLDVAQSRAQAKALRAQGDAIALRMQGSRAAGEQSGGQLGPEGGTFTLTDVLFSSGKATLKPGGYNRLQQLASYLRSHPGMHATVEGFTDSTGGKQLNQRLSQARAQEVRRFLVNAGVDPSRVTARGMGESYPIASNATAAGRQANRRVEVVVKPA